jgi:hypothetical protein
MTRLQIAKLWSVVSAVLLYYSLNSWLASQGGQEIFAVKLVAAGRVPTALLAILICAILITATSWIGQLFAKRSGPSWHDRIPVVGFESIETASTEGKIYQGVMLVLLSLLPAASLAHFWHILAGAKVVTTGESPRLARSIWDWAALSSFDNPATVCADLKSNEPPVCNAGVTFLPGLEPALLALLTALALLSLVLHWRRVLAK